MRNIHFRKVILILLIIFLSFILLTFIFRDILVSAILTKKIDRFNHTYHAGLRVEKIQVQWLASILLTGLTVSPEGRDTLLKVDSVFISVNLWKMVTGRLVLQNLMLRNIKCSLVRKKKETNYDLFIRKKELRTDTTAAPLNYAIAVDRLCTFIFDKIPKWIQIRNFKLSYYSDGHSLLFQFADFTIRDHTFSVPFLISENDTTQRWIVEGMIDRDLRTAGIRINSSDKNKVSLPFLFYKWNAKIAIDSVYFKVSETGENDFLTHVSGISAIYGFKLEHPRISTRPVEVGKFSIRYQVNIGAYYGELDSSTKVMVNHLDFNPYIRYTTRPTRQIAVKLNKPLFPAEDLFSSLPKGLFSNLEGIRAKGDLSYNFDFFVDLSVPDSLHFNSELKRHHFSVVSYGDNDLTRINTPFQYTAYERGEPVRTFTVGPENPDYRAIERISPFLKASILTSEDPSFYQHRGFLMDAFRESIIENIKERKFSRGGSTISMQLVKNVFLNRNKTIARKFEEAILVWLIENQGLSTKERMFEVYLNIIEWGPLIYGANEAARFYFNKDAARLNLAESIFLASIIPRPKWFKYSFNEYGHLRESQAGYYSLLSEKMLKRGWISQQEYDRLIPDVELKGPARFLINRNDSFLGDSLYYPDER